MNNIECDCVLNPKISVVIITYNHGEKIIRCLNSLLTSKTQEIELIIADDCSSDNTQEIVQAWINDNKPRFKTVNFIRNKYNMGTVSNIISGISASKSEFIKLLAGDDWFCNGALDYLSTFITLNSFDVAFCPVLVAIENDSGEAELMPYQLDASKLVDFFYFSSEKQFNALALANLLPAPGSFFSRHFWEKIELNKYELKIAEDWAMWLLGSLKKMRFLKINEPLVVYFKHGDSVTNNKKTHKLYLQGLKDLIVMYKSIVLANKNKLFPTVLLRVRINYIALIILIKLPFKISFNIIQLLRKIRRKISLS